MRSYETHESHDKPNDVCPEYVCGGTLLMVNASDVDEAIIDYVVNLVDSDYGDSRIDWETVFDFRLEGMIIDDGRMLTLGDEYDTPAMKKIKREVNKIRKNS